MEKKLTKKELEEMERKEVKGWMMLGEKALQEIWDNPKDEAHWKRYLTEAEKKKRRVK